jgi:hypothetical protein
MLDGRSAVGELVGDVTTSPFSAGSIEKEDSDEEREIRDTENKLPAI